jgi:hypothetical protein
MMKTPVNNAIANTPDAGMAMPMPSSGQVY